MRRYRFCEAIITAVIITVIIVWVGVARGEGIDDDCCYCYRLCGWQCGAFPGGCSGEGPVSSVGDNSANHCLLACLNKAVASRKNQVTAYKASDGKLFESREEMEEYDNKDRLKKAFLRWADELREDLKKGIFFIHGDPKILTLFITQRWPEIKAIMEEGAKP